MSSTPEDYSRIPTSVKVVIGLMAGILFGVIVVEALLTLPIAAASNARRLFLRATSPIATMRTLRVHREGR